MYYYVYYRFFVMVHAVDKTASHWYATIEVTLMDYLILWILLFLAFPKWAHSALMISDNRVYSILGLMLVLFVPNYMLFIYRQRYKDVLAVFKTESKAVKVLADALTLGLLVALVIVAITLE